MTDYIKATLADLLADLQGWFIHYLTLQFVDPIWWWAGALVLLYLAVTALCWFFGTYWPVLRVIGGFLLLAGTFGLYAYKKGADDARAHDAKRKRRRP